MKSRIGARPSGARVGEERCGLLPLLVLCTGLLAAGCGGTEESFKARLADAASGRSGDPLFALVALDQSYPDRLELKLAIGALLLTRGRIEEAGAYLERGRSLVRLFEDRRLVYLLESNLAEYYLRAGRPGDSVKAADRALAHSDTDSVGVVFTKAKALAASERTEEALAAFEGGRVAGSGAVMNIEDYGVYLALLAGADRMDALIDVYRERQERFGYIPGQGLEESSILESRGRIRDAVGAALMEIEYRYARGAIGEDGLGDALDAIGRTLGSGNRGGEEGDLIEAYKRLHGDPGRPSFAATPAAGPDSHVFVKFVHAALRLAEAPTDEVYRDYQALERDLKDLPTYYLHLWRSMKKATPSYSLATARSLMERAIALAPAGPAAKPSRRELGRLLGIGEASSEDLLIGPELDAIGAALASGAPVAVLEPVVRLQATPDNVYQLAGLVLLRSVARTPGGRAFLQTRIGQASGRIHERLTSVLAGP